MKRILIVAGLFLIGLRLAAQDSRINKLIRQKELLKVEALIDECSPLSREARTIYKALLQNAFGRAVQSASLLKSIENPSAIKDDTLRHFYYSISYDNAVKLFQYKKAAITGTHLLEHFRSFYTKQELEEEKQALLIWKTLANAAMQTISRPDTTIIPLQRDIAGLWTVPVTAKDSTYDFVFDSGAGLSVVTESYAKLIGVRTFHGTIVPIRSGVTGLETPAKPGIAPLLKLENMVIRNAVFLVFPDEALSFANGAYKIKGIIGFPVIKEMGVLHFTGDELMATKNDQSSFSSSNMIIDQLKPVIYLKYGNDLLPFTFDSGAKTSIFSDVFYKRYKRQLQRTGIPSIETLGGASGEVALQTLEMPELKLYCLDKKIVLKKIPVSKEPISTTGEIYYGNIGQDVITQFKTMVINFKGCFIRFED